MLKTGMLFHDRYRLVEMKGRGSFGEVWLARDEQLDIEVAVKVYIALDDHGVAEFKKEYTTTFGLNHPNLLHAYHFDQFGNRPYLVMPYCPESAMALIGNCDEPTLWRFVRDVASGLAYLHEKDILHHDIKPDNVLRDQEGNFLITDFGISTKMRSTLRRNSTHQANAAPMAGTIPYMAPEMFAASPDSVKATDIWALGATLFEMSEGELPFFGQGGVMQRSGAEVPDLHSGFSATFCQTVQQCLAKDTWARPTAQQLADRAKAMLEGRNPEAFAVQKPLPVNRSTQSMNRPPVADGNRGKNVVNDSPASQTPTGQDGPPKKKRAWIAGVAGVAVAAIVAVVMLMRPTDADSNFFNQCRSVADYRAYVATYGTAGKHHAEAKAFIDGFVADSLKAVDSLRQVQQLAQQREAEAKTQADAEKKEESAYKKCTTVAGCESYLKAYPKGKYVDEVKAKKAELEAKEQQEAEKQEDEAYRRCTTIAACESYLKAYPKGRYVSEVRTKKAKLEQEQQAQQAQQGGNGSAGGHDYVDLGLPSGTLWATCNVGATKPEGYGNYYAWGETKPQSSNTYNWSSYKYANGNYDKLTKYCNKSSYGNNGFTDNLTELQIGDDPAAANWGGGWRTPTKAQWDELLANTTNQWTTKNGVSGRLFTSKKNGQTLFLPAAGERWGSELNFAGSSGDYWSRSLNAGDPGSAWDLHFGSYGCLMRYYPRYNGLTVRPVRQN